MSPGVANKSESDLYYDFTNIKLMQLTFKFSKKSFRKYPFSFKNVGKQNKEYNFK